MNNSSEASDKINKYIIDIIGSETEKKTPTDLAKYLKNKFNLSREDAKSYLKNLISKGDLEYSDCFGRTFVGISFSKPVRISERIVLSPPDKKYQKGKNDIVAVIEKGISFGRGTHPTTRLCLQGIDFVLGDKSKPMDNSTVLDIGTGSGVLVIAGVLFGINSAHACDLDMVSLNEAYNNIKRNNLSDRITLGKTFDSTQKYTYIFANLRFPTLIDLHDTMINITERNSYIFLSGIKVEEKEKIIKKYSSEKFSKIWEKTESGWIGFVFLRL